MNKANEANVLISDPVAARVVAPKTNPDVEEVVEPESPVDELVLVEVPPVAGSGVGVAVGLTVDGCGVGVVVGVDDGVGVLVGQPRTQGRLILPSSTVPGLSVGVGARVLVGSITSVGLSVGSGVGILVGSPTISVGVGV